MASRKLTFDKPLAWIIGSLVIAGIIILASASAPISEKAFGSQYYLLWKQLLLGVGVGGILFLLALRVSPLVYKKYAILILLSAVFLVAMVFIPPFGTTIKGAARWIFIGPVSFQPSEFLKLALIIYLSAWMSNKKRDLGDFKTGFFPFLLITGFSGFLLMFQPDIGTLGVLAVTSLGMFFMGGARLRQIAFAIVLGFLLLVILVQVGGYRKDRISVFLNPQDNILSQGYQLDQALIAIGSGGFWGKGLGLSRQKFQYLPEPAGDAIFAIFAEEFGLVGSVILLGLFFAFFVRGMMIAMGARDLFVQYLASGIVLLVTTQALINIAALTGLIPVTGIPLPFISQGGTSLALLLFEMGILLRVSQKKLV